MKKFELDVVDSDFAKPHRSVVEKLEAPIQLTPDQLEIVAGGFMLRLGSGTSSTTATTGLYPAQPFPKLS